MKPTTNTPDLLIIEDRPWLTGLLISGAVMGFAIAGAGALLAGKLAGLLYLLGAAAMMLFFYFFVRRSQAVFHAPEGWVEIRQRRLTGYSASRHNLAEVERAIVETSTDSDGGATHRVTLLIRGDAQKRRLAVTQVYTGGSGASRCVGAINAWLDSQSQRS